MSGCGLEARVGWRCALPPRGTAEENQWGGQRVGCLVPEGHPGGGEQRAGGRPGPGLWEARSGVTGQGLVYCGGRVRRGRDSGWRHSEGSRDGGGRPTCGAGKSREGPSRAGQSWDGREAAMELAVGRRRVLLGGSRPCSLQTEGTGPRLCLGGRSSVPPAPLCGQGWGPLRVPSSPGPASAVAALPLTLLQPGPGGRPTAPAARTTPMWTSRG